MNNTKNLPVTLGEEGWQVQRMYQKIDEKGGVKIHPTHPPVSATDISKIYKSETLIVLLLSKLKRPFAIELTMNQHKSTR